MKADYWLIYMCTNLRSAQQIYDPYFGVLAVESIKEALKTAGAEDDLPTILRVLEDKSVGFKHHEAAAGPFENMDTAMLTGLNIRMLSVIKRAQQ